MNEIKKPKVTHSASERELDKAQEQFDAFDANIKELVEARTDNLPKLELEPQTKLAQSEIALKKDIYLKPFKIIGSKEKFNDKWRDEYNFQKEYVQFIYEHKELIGDTLEIWTKRFPGVPAELWHVPANTPVWGPRYLAEQISTRIYRRLVMKDTITQTNGVGTMHGQLAADTIVPRLTATPVSQRKSIFMGANNF